MPKSLKVDVVIFGGGIAGLWSLLSLRKQGYSAILFESNQLGGLQSMASQGILHGGTKYALTGKQSAASEAISRMPAIWQSCLEGHGELDLTAVRVLTSNQFLWSTQSLTSKISGFFASKLMRSRIQVLDKKDHPAPFNTDKFKGALYALDEPVLDTGSLMKELSSQAAKYCWKLSPTEIEVLDENVFSVGNNKQIIEAESIVFSAGEGNEALLSLFKKDQPKMQRRPLHMVMMRGKLPSVFAHCIEASSNPRVTVTSYPMPDGGMIWYLGGQLAEKGVEKNTEEQIVEAKKLLTELLPWVSFDQINWTGFLINRAEPKMEKGKRPDDCYVHQEDNVFTVWPTKLVFAPRVADKLSQKLLKPVVGKENEDFAILSELIRPTVSQHIALGNETWN